MSELARRPATCLSYYGYDNVHVAQGDGYGVWPSKAPFVRIVATAAVDDLPAAWFDQLVDGGVIVAPVGVDGDQRLLKFRKQAGPATREDLGGVAFVPCRHEASP